MNYIDYTTNEKRMNREEKELNFMQSVAYGLLLAAVLFVTIMFFTLL